MPANGTAANALTAEIRVAGGEVFAIKGDVGNEADVLTMFQVFDSTHVGLDAFVNNVGIIGNEIHASWEQPYRIAVIRGFVPMKREGKAEEVAHAVIWLLSEEVSYTTGSILNVSGGRLPPPRQEGQDNGI